MGSLAPTMPLLIHAMYGGAGRLLEDVPGCANPHAPLCGKKGARGALPVCLLLCPQVLPVNFPLLLLDMSEEVHVL